MKRFWPIHSGFSKHLSRFWKEVMALNKNKAIQYNKNRGYETRAVRLIQSLVGAPIHGAFDEVTVKAIYDWQGSSRRMATLVQDGMIGPNSLGSMIAELRRADKHLEASVLAPHPHNLPSGFTDPDDNPLKYFSHRTISSLDLRRPESGEGVNGWVMRGCFEVKFELKPDIADPNRYEYRQLIRGSAGTTDGWFKDSALTQWEALSGEASANHIFKMPNGLPRVFKEDAHKTDGIIERFGYRSKMPVYKPSGVNGLIDRYTPDQKGYGYQCRDTFGLADTSPSVVGTRVRLELDFIGYVYDKLLVRTVVQKTWSYRKTEFVKW
jgi:hypothetical protein